MIRRRRRRGFTLIEVLLVLVILVVLGSLVGIQVRSAQKSAYLKAAKAQIGGFETPLETYSLHAGHYPSNLGDLVSAPSDAQGKWEGPYMKTIPADPWGRAYNYASPGRHNPDSFDVWSTGPDGADNTEDDIGNW